MAPSHRSAESLAPAESTVRRRERASARKSLSGLLGGLGNLVYGFLSPYVGLLADLHRSSLTLTLIGTLPWLAFVAIFRAVPRDTK